MRWSPKGATCLRVCATGDYFSSRASMTVCKRLLVPATDTLFLFIHLATGGVISKRALIF